MTTIMIIVGSTRPERLGELVGKWVGATAQQRDAVQLDIADLRDVQLPFYDERSDIGSLKGNFTHQEGKEWNERLEKADGFIMVTPEYNHGPPATLKNAIDYGWAGWHYKPVSYVSYSTGAIGGARAVEQLRLMTAGVKLLSLPGAVHIPRVTNEITPDAGAVHDATQAALDSLLDELIMIASKLK